MRIDASENQATGIISYKVRLLSVVSGCFTGIAGSFGFGPLFLIYPVLLIAGAIIQPRRRILGRGLMLSGAVLLIPVTVFFASAIVDGARMLRGYHDLNFLGVLSAMVVSVLLACWCDVQLVISEVKVRRAQRPHSPPSS
jgi:hypothetical protein